MSSNIIMFLPLFIPLLLLCCILIIKHFKNKQLKCLQKEMEEVFIKEMNLGEDYRKLFEWIDKNVPKDYDANTNTYYMHVINVLFGDLCTLKRQNAVTSYLVINNLYVSKTNEKNWMINFQPCSKLQDKSNIYTVTKLESITKIAKNDFYHLKKQDRITIRKMWIDEFSKRIKVQD